MGSSPTEATGVIMKVGDLVKYNKDFMPYVRLEYANRPSLVIEVTSSPLSGMHTALVLTSEGLIRRRYQWQVEVISESR